MGLQVTRCTARQAQPKTPRQDLDWGKVYYGSHGTQHMIPNILNLIRSKPNVVEVEGLGSRRALVQNAVLTHGLGFIGLRAVLVLREVTILINLLNPTNPKVARTSGRAPLHGPPDTCPGGPAFWDLNWTLLGCISGAITKTTRIWVQLGSFKRCFNQNQHPLEAVLRAVLKPKQRPFRAQQTLFSWCFK